MWTRDEECAGHNAAWPLATRARQCDRKRAKSAASDHGGRQRVYGDDVIMDSVHVHNFN